ncbi:MAG: TfoX/Sxy family protein [Gammaproteobacteria bacterium]|nr:TfoX/Sxy family protein [Gammaproteobacteria bacterium]
MAKVYLEKLCRIIEELELEKMSAASLQVKHFFSGAALYANGRICASWSPQGLAFRLPESEVTEVIDSGKAKPLKYFDKGNVKKGYVLFVDPEKLANGACKQIIISAITHSL